MKRSMEELAPMADVEKLKKKKKKGEEEEAEKKTGIGNLDENLLFEVLKNVDAKSLAVSSCVCKQWYKTAQDERLWEIVCTRHWANIGCGNRQLRSVVLALGGFRRLHSLCLWPLLKPPPSLPLAPSSSSSSRLTPSKTPSHWGKDEVNLSLSLLSIRHYEKMNVTRRR